MRHESSGKCGPLGAAKGEVLARGEPNARNVTRLLVSADDLGISSEVNHAITELARTGAITSTSVMANGPAWEQGVHSALLVPKLSLGVHLNITQFYPLCGAKALRPLLDADGVFRGQKVRWMAVGHDLAGAVYNEFCAQIDRIRSLGVEITHLDSHHHVHTNPWLFTVILEIQRHYGIQRVRTGWNLWTSKPIRARILKPIRRIWARRLEIAAGARMTDYCSDFATIYSLRDQLPAGSSVEAIVHPGHPRYLPEMQLLLSSEWQASSDRFEFISYHDI